MTDATRNLLEQHFDTAFAAPDGIKKLRELILTLAMQGKLVAQDPNDPPASELLKQIEAEKQRLHASSSPRRRGSSGLKDLDSRFRGNDAIKTKSLPPIRPEEMPYELPQGWEWVRLGIIAEINGGFAFKSSQYSNEGIRVVRISDFDEKGFKDDKIVRYPYSAELISFNLESNNILMAMTGGTVGKSLLVKSLPEPMVTNQRVATIKIATGIIPEFINGLIRTDLIQSVIHAAKNSTNDNISMGDITGFFVPLPPLPEQHRIVAKIDQLMAKCDELEALRKGREVKRRAVHAAAIKQLLDTTSSFPQACPRADGERESSSSKELDLRSPAEREQAYGGDGVSAYGWNFIQQHFGELYTVKENVAELRKAILQLAVMGRLVPQDPNDPPASELLKEIEAEKQRLHASSSSPRKRGSSGVKDLDSRLRGNDGIRNKSVPPIKLEEMPYELPKGWEWVRLDVLASKIGSGSTPRGGKTAYVDNGIPFLRSQNVWNDGLKLKDVAYITPEIHERMSATEVLGKDILLNITGASLGRCALVPDEFSIANVSQHVTIIRCIKEEQRQYLHKVLLSPYCQRIIWSRQVGMAREGLSKKVLEQFEIPLPPLPEQHRIVAKIDQLMALCDRLEQQIDAATGKQTELLNALMAAV